MHFLDKRNQAPTGHRLVHSWFKKLVIAVLKVDKTVVANILLKHTAET